MTFSSPKSWLISLILLLAAIGAFAFVFSLLGSDCPLPPKPPKEKTEQQPQSKEPPSSVHPEERLRQILPEADPNFIRRASAKWGDTAIAAAKQHGESGLHVLEIFGDEAAYCLKHQSHAFEALVQVTRLDPPRFRLATGPWNRAVLDWAQNANLPRFMDRLRNLPPDQLEIAEKCPDALPLLFTDRCPTAKRMLDRYGVRAWSLFMAINFIEHPQDVEKAAQAIDREGELILRLNEQYGLPCALLLVPPDTQNSRDFPRVVKYALRTLTPSLNDEAATLAFVLVNYESIVAVLREGKSAEQIEKSIDLFGILPPTIQELALDHKYTLRLLMETWKGQSLGVEVLRRCGPAAADLVYKYYASDDQLKWPALVAMAKSGFVAYQVLERFRDYGNFHKFLRRANAELMDPRGDPPAIVHTIQMIAKRGQEQVDIYATVRNLKGQVLADAQGPSPAETYLEWVPGYIVYRTTMNYLDGKHVTGGDIFWAAVDAAGTVTVIYGPVTSSLKTMGRKLVQEGVKQAERTLVETADKLVLKVLKEEGTDLTRRFGQKAASLAEQRLQARSQEGLKLVLTNRREEYLNLARTGDINGKARIVEEIGTEGALKYIEAVGYEPLYRLPPRRGMGFDLPPCRDGERIVVIEAKGGSSPLRNYHGHEQGTIEYTKAVAEWTRQSSVTTKEEKRAAEEVLKAAREGRLFVEVVRTEHNQGTPGITRVERIVGPKGPITPSLADTRQALLLTPGMVAIWIKQTGGIALAERDLAAWIKQGHSIAKHTGIHLWNEASSVSPLAGRRVIRKGEKIIIPVRNHVLMRESVSEFAIAILERSM
jgi:hypothetical protein